MSDAETKAVRMARDSVFRYVEEERDRAQRSLSLYEDFPDFHFTKAYQSERVRLLEKALEAVE